MFLAGPVRVATALGERDRHLVVVVPRLVSEVGGGSMPVVHVGIAVDVGVDPVGVAAVEQLADHLHHLVDRLGGRDVVARR